MVSICPQKSLSNKDNSGLLESNLFAIWDPSATPQDDKVEDIGYTEGSLSKFQQSISSNHFKFQFIVGFGYTFRYKTNAPLNRHSEALPKNLTPREGTVEHTVIRFLGIVFPIPRMKTARYLRSFGNASGWPRISPQWSDAISARKPENPNTPDQFRGISTPTSHLNWVDSYRKEWWQWIKKNQDFISQQP